MTYTEVVVALVLAIPLAGFVTEVLLRQFRLRGYGRIAAHVAAIARAIHGEIDRDSGDLLIRGSMSSAPVLVRFSHSEQRPGLHIQLPAAGNISLFCVPKGHESEGGIVRLNSRDPRFEERFRLTSNHPGLAQILFCTPAISAEIQKLCRTSRSFLALQQQRLELSELLIPEENLSQRVLDSIRGMMRIATTSRQMPGGEPEQIQYPRRWNWFRTAYIGGPVLLLSSLLLVARLQRPADVPQPLPVPSGIADDEARQIPEVQHWRLAQASDFDAEAVAWLLQQGHKPRGLIRGALAGNGGEDSAYVLKHISVSPGEPSRLVVFVKGQARFDANMPIAIAARIPKDRIGAIEWRDRRPPGPPDGDGILVIQRYQDASSAIVLFSSGVQLLTGRPKDFHAVSLQ